MSPRLDRMLVPLLVLVLAACGRADAPSAMPAGASAGPAAGDPPSRVRVLSYRAADVVGPLFARFEAETGIAVDLVPMPADAINDFVLGASDAEVPDLVLSVDAIRFEDLAATGSLRALPTAALAAVPATLRDPEGLWLGLSYRLRGPLYAAGVAPDAGWPVFLDALPDRRVCNRDPAHVYSVGTVAWLVGAHGEGAARAFVAGVLSRAPIADGGDRDQILALLDGRCEVAIVNHYYLARLLESGSDDERGRLAATRFGFATGGEGLIGNVSAIAVTRRGARPDAADRLAVWLTGREALAEHARIFAEYPASWPDSGVELPASLTSMADLAMAPPPPSGLAATVPAARRLLAER
jgi:iron(III) transport system substrate-binding protein